MNTHILEQLRHRVEGKNVLIFGLGIQGGGTRVAILLHELGAKVRVSDRKSRKELAISLKQLPAEIIVSVGEQRQEDVDWAQLIIKNPSVPYTHPLIEHAMRQGIPVTTETALALEIVRQKSVGITGTRGKSTTTALIHHILVSNGVDAILCGNIPQKPTLAMLAEATDNSWFVIEMSSYHLEACEHVKLSPHFAVLTNIYPDHLDRYGSLEAYAAVKLSIFRNQQVGDHAFLNESTKEKWGSEAPVGVAQHIVDATRMTESTTQYASLLPGTHNQENIALATLVAEVFGIEKAGIQHAVSTFTGLPYRLQTVGEKNGIRFINDTTSTTPTALEKALDATIEPHILITGGATKKLPFTESLLTKIRQQLPFIVWLKGSGTQELMSALGLNEVDLTVVPSLSLAIETAWKMANDTHRQSILFSPGFTSFEMFKNEFDRGDQFNTLIQKIVHS